MPESKQDRELIELLNELRVALPGVQVLFAFLLAVPFSQGFPKMTSLQRGLLFTALVTTSLSSALLIAPSAYHRLRWRRHDKEQMLVSSNRFAIAGLAFLAVAMTAVVFLVTDVLFETTVAAVVAAINAVVFGGLWYARPLLRSQDQDG